MARNLDTFSHKHFVYSLSHKIKTNTAQPNTRRMGVFHCGAARRQEGTLRRFTVAARHWNLVPPLASSLRMPASRPPRRHPLPMSSLSTSVPLASSILRGNAAIPYVKVLSAAATAATSTSISSTSNGSEGNCCCQVRITGAGGRPAIRQHIASAGG